MSVDRQVFYMYLKMPIIGSIFEHILSFDGNEFFSEVHKAICFEHERKFLGPCYMLNEGIRSYFKNANQ